MRSLLLSYDALVWWVDKMAEWMKEVAPRSDDLNSVPRTCIVERENRLSAEILSNPHTYCDQVLSQPISK